MRSGINEKAPRISTLGGLEKLTKKQHAKIEHPSSTFTYCLSTHPGRKFVSEAVFNTLSFTVGE